MAPITRSRDASCDRLPTDVLYSVLQQFPVKDLCRLRTVCSSWRSITCDQAFVREHAERHKEPLFLAKFRDDRRNHVCVVDLSVKRIAGADGGHQVLRKRLDLVSLARERNTCRVLNPATGGIQVFPPVPAAEDRAILQTSFSLGLVGSTGEYKVLCCWRQLFCHHGLFGSRPLLSGVHVLTISGGSGTDHGQWRPRPDALLSIVMDSGVVVGGVVYFLTSAGVPSDCILSFDLATEEWRRHLYGPSLSGHFTSGVMVTSDLTLADLKGSLVLAHHPRGIMDIWFLLDFESRLWEIQYSIITESVTTSLARYHLIPLLALDDGRLVIHLAPHGQLFICDPETNTFSRVDTRVHLDSVGVYTGSLLSLQERYMV